MDGGAILHGLALIERELLLFAGVFFLLGALDELLVDGLWGYLRLSRRVPRLALDRGEVRARRLAGRAAVCIPAWQEDAVIGTTLQHALSAWPHDDFVIYVGCYRNDMKTLEAAMKGAGTDRRVRLVVHDCDGPSTKADCLNRLYRAMEVDEQRLGASYRMVVLHDAEDMVDPAALALLDKAIDRAEFVQLPVMPLPQHGHRWLGSHYCEEFAEAHGKTMVVRDWLGACLPAAGVGCAVERAILRRIAAMGDGRPFAVDSLTEDYELGMRVQQYGGRSRFLRVRGEDGSLIATRAYFPARLNEAVRQKARWVHGIALQGWDRLGWAPPGRRDQGGWLAFLAESWMRLRDRRGPMAALVLACGYGFFLLSGLLMIMGQLGLARPWQGDPLLSALVGINLVAFAWRAVWRAAFTWREYGWWQALLAVLRIPVTNAIAIMAGRRAFAAYLRTLGGGMPHWEKTRHDRHPAAKAPVAVMVPACTSLADLPFDGPAGLSAGHSL